MVNLFYNIEVCVHLSLINALLGWFFWLKMGDGQRLFSVSQAVIQTFFSEPDFFLVSPTVSQTFLREPDFLLVSQTFYSWARLFTHEPEM